MLDLEVIMMALHGEYWTCSCMNTVFSQLLKRRVFAVKFEINAPSVYSRYRRLFETEPFSVTDSH